MPDGAFGFGLPQTRRATIAFGGKLAAISGLIAGFGAFDAEAKRKKRKHKKQKPQPDYRLEAPQMTGAKEVPGPGDPTADGSANFTIKSNGTICVGIAFSSTSDSEITGVHIHQGDSVTKGPIVVDFGDLADDICVPIDKNLASQIKANPASFYANFHTGDFTDGAVRDQLRQRI